MWDDCKKVRVLGELGKRNYGSNDKRRILTYIEHIDISMNMKFS